MNDEEQWEELNRLHDELDFLRYFFDAAQDSFGPADADVTISIIEEYEENTGNSVPEEYDWRK